MALELPADWNNTGLAATYFRIMRVEVDFGIEPGVTVLVYAYASKEARDAGLAPVASREVRLGTEQLAERGVTLNSLTRKALYETVRDVVLPGATEV